jgi:hypothetical protein
MTLFGGYLGGKKGQKRGQNCDPRSGILRELNAGGGRFFAFFTRPKWGQKNVFFVIFDQKSQKITFFWVFWG